MRALVTGASSGIGAAIARELAADGVHLVLTARRRGPLDELAAACIARGVRVDVITTDLGIPEAAAALWLAARASGPIDILINNAGFGYFRAFGDADWARDAELLQLNVTSLVELTHSLVRERRGGTAPTYVLNIASTAAYQSVPRFAVYASSKAFVRNFTEGLHDELAGSAMSATCICPGGTRTAFHAAAGAGEYGAIANASMLSAEAVATIGLRAMRRRRRTVIPGAMNKLSCWGVRLVPRWIASRVATWVLGSPRDSQLPARTLPPGGST
jgi:hypothetical protein